MGCPRVGEALANHLGCGRNSSLELGLSPKEILDSKSAATRPALLIIAAMNADGGLGREGPFSSYVCKGNRN